MMKIYPVNNIRFDSTRQCNKPKPKFYEPQNSSYLLPFTGSNGVVLSTFLRDYNKTVDENYFQFKQNPETEKPFEPDEFQTAAAMNLYLGNNVLVTAPTGTGKTAIAEYIITKNLDENKTTYYTTPLKALSNEKFLEFQKIYGKENVGLLTGDTKINKDAPIIVMTTEVYRNMVASKLFKDNYSLPNDLKTIIFDELQYLGDYDRGGIWEQAIMFTPPEVQILSLSATIGNNKEINEWMASTGYKKTSQNITPEQGYLPDTKKINQSILINVPTENRHVPLEFEILPAKPKLKSNKDKVKGNRDKSKNTSQIQQNPLSNRPDFETYNKLTKNLQEQDKLPAIYFIFSKRESANLLKFLSENGDSLTNDEEKKELNKIINRYKREDNIYLGEMLNKNALLNGYAIHNAGLLPAQKRLVEELFQKKLVKVVISTETLSAGINMPARTTIISTPRKPSSTQDELGDGKRFLTANEFHQMAGRAGRRGIDTHGYCYALSCNPVQSSYYDSLIKSSPNNLESNLKLDYSFIVSYFTEFKNINKLKSIFSKSLYTYDEIKKLPDNEKINELLKDIDNKIELLKIKGFLSKENEVTHKGVLLSKLNGYEQIPIIDVISDKTLENLTAVQLAGIVGGLANLSYQVKDKEKNKFYLDNEDDKALLNAAKKVQYEIKNYNSISENLHENQELVMSSDVIKHLYSWAELNKNDEDSRKNWHDLIFGDLKDSISDEGTIFKEITMTTDLIKQLIHICKVGSDSVSNDYEKYYYKRLANKLADTLELIQREPANEESI